MRQKPNLKMRLILFVSLIVILIVAGFFWMKAAYRPSQAIAVAQEFLHHLGLKEFSEAYALTVQNNEYVGKTLAEFSSISSQNPCENGQMKYTFPFQSNSNRLRRWLSGKDVDMLEVSVEFDCPYPYRVTLRHLDGKWKVFNFEAHAG